MKTQSRSVVGCLLSLIVLSGWLMGCESDLDKARGLVKAKQYKEAGKVYEKILKTNPKDMTALKEVTKLFCETSYDGFMCLDKAQILYDKLPTHPKVKEWLKRALYNGAYERTTSMELIKAQEYLDRYYKLDKTNPKAHFIGGLIKYRQGKKPPYDRDDLNAAIKELRLAIKYASPSTTIKLNPKDKTPTPLQWEAQKMIANIYELQINLDFQKFKPKKKGDQFVPDAKLFAGAVAAYQAAHKLNHTQPNKKVRFYPLYQIAMLYFNYKKDKKKALDILLQAEKSFPKSRNVIRTIKVVYRMMAKDLKKKRGRKARRLRKAYEKKAKEYAAKEANLPK